jgi:hypothetical protein
MTKSQKQANANFFNRYLSMTNDGGTYIWPDANEIYTVKAGKFYGTPRGVKKMMKHTPKAFHKNIRLAK